MSAVYMWCHNNSSLTLCWRVQEHLIHSPICTIHQHLLIYCENFPLSRSIWMPFQSYFLLGRGFLQMLWGSSYSFHFFKFLVYQTSQKIFTRHEMKPKEEKKRVEKKEKKNDQKTCVKCYSQVKLRCKAKCKYRHICMCSIPAAHRGQIAGGILILVTELGCWVCSSVTVPNV